MARLIGRWISQQECGKLVPARVQSEEEVQKWEASFVIYVRSHNFLEYVA